MTRTSIHFTLILFIAYSAAAFSQAEDTASKPYDVKLDANIQINTALKQAKKEHKHVLVQIGGNWCSWCLKLHKLYKSNARIDSILHADYVLVYANYSSENKNTKAMERLGHPERFGFPVLVVLNAEGVRLHTQDSGLLEGGPLGHDPDKVMTFLRNWTRKAVDPQTYK
jgi:thiol:disulfide interchange protein